MARVIYKYEAQQLQQLSFPGPARPVAYAFQEGQPQMWVEHTLTGAMETWNFVVFGTGWPISDPELKYIATAMAPDGVHIWHLYGKRVS